MQTNKSCGILLIDEIGTHFLLLRSPKKWDLPKGHIKKRETELECAIREFKEETSVDASAIQLIDDFKFCDITYHQDKITKKYSQKEIVIFLAKLKEKVKIRTTEHLTYKWCEFNSKIEFDNPIIENLLDYTKEFLKDKEL
jgi:8-oxo-dGTP pyrophosphatase MutT (NUDIX family)